MSSFDFKAGPRLRITTPRTADGQKHVVDVETAGAIIVAITSEGPLYVVAGDGRTQLATLAMLGVFLEKEFPSAVLKFAEVMARDPDFQESLNPRRVTLKIDLTSPPNPNPE